MARVESVSILVQESNFLDGCITRVSYEIFGNFTDRSDNETRLDHDHMLAHRSWCGI